MKVKRFYWKLSSKAKMNEFFSPNASKELYEKYGIFYVIGMIFIFIALFMPCVFFISLVPEDTTIPYSIGAFLSIIPAIAGIIGSLAIGIGLVNILAAIFRQYLGHIVTLVCIFGGLAVTILSHWLLILINTYL